MGLFSGKGKSSALEILRGAEWSCASCSGTHQGMMDLSVKAPDPWPHGHDYEANKEVTLERDFLSEDFCVLASGHYFVRCVIEIPVRGLEMPFGYGCWGSLSRENFEHYLALFYFPDPAQEPEWWSWLANWVKPYSVGSDPVGSWMYPRQDGLRPLLKIADEHHPLAVAQQKGISPEEMLQIYAEYGHAPQL